MNPLWKTTTFVVIVLIVILVTIPSISGEEPTASKKQYMGYGGVGYGLGYGGPGYGSTGYGAPGFGAPGYGAPGYGAPGYIPPAAVIPPYGHPAIVGGNYGPQYGGLVPPYPGNYGGYGEFLPQQQYPPLYPAPSYAPNYIPPPPIPPPVGGFYPGYPGNGMFQYSAKNSPAPMENA